MNRAIVALEVVSSFGIEASIELALVGIIAVIACVFLVPASPSYATTPDVAPALTALVTYMNTDCPPVDVQCAKGKEDIAKARHDLSNAAH